MNKPIRTVAVFCLVLFLALMVNASYLQVFKAGQLNDDPRNGRVQEEAYSSERGAILVNRTPIAESVRTDDRYEFLRQYPTPLLYAHATGYFSLFSSSGIEQQQNAVLSGDDPRFFVRRLVDLVSNKPPQGGNVQLTLDPDAQRAAYDGLTALGDDVKGAVVALEPDSGRILAMVSLPTFNPQRLSSHDFSAAGDLLTNLNNNPDKPLLNRAIGERLFPGSTFKLVTAAAALENNIISGPDDQVPGGDSFQLPQTSSSAGLVENGGRACGTNGGTVPLRQAMAQSCNTTFAQLAINLGIDPMLEQAERFGFNSTQLEDLGGQAPSRFPDNADAPQVGLTGFGQFEVQATPLQMAMVVAAIGNNGVVMRPHIVQEVQSADYDADPTEPEEISEAISPNTADVLTDVMVSTVDDGTAATGAIPGVAVAGKTGTAQRGIEGSQPYGWFVSFAPAQNPEVAVAVMIESAPGQEIGGGSLGGPIAKAVMEAVLQ